MSLVAQEAQVLESIVPKLVAEGYSVYLRPSASLLPPFMQNYVPNAIALGRPKNLAIEIVSERSPSTDSLDRIRDRFRDVYDWELRVYYARPTEAQNAVEAVSKAAVEASLRTIQKLIADGQMQPALLMAWATLEALGRLLVSRKLSRPQEPQQLVEVLASEGFVTPSEADMLRRIANERNRVAHGSLESGIERTDLVRLTAVLATLLGFVGDP